MPKKTKDASSGAIISASNEIKTTANVKVTDLSGIGALGKTPAGKAIAQNISSALADTIRMGAAAFLGAKATKVEADRIVALARATGEARLIEADTEAALLARAGERIRSDEIRRQSYIEDSARKAIDIADENSNSKKYCKHEDLDPELILTWIDGVKDAHSEFVRDLYSRLMASYATGEVERVRGPSLMLLKQLDGDLARKFADFVAIILIYGIYPHMGYARPAEDFALSDDDISYLLELGFIKDTNDDCFKFKDFSITYGLSRLPRFHGLLVLSQRGYEIANAVFEDKETGLPLRNRSSSEDTIVKTYLNCINGMMNERGGLITFKNNYGLDDAILYSISNPTKLPFEEILPDSRIANLSKASREAIRQAHVESRFGFRLADPGS